MPSRPLPVVGLLLASLAFAPAMALAVDAKAAPAAKAAEKAPGAPKHAKAATKAAAPKTALKTVPKTVLKAPPRVIATERWTVFTEPIWVNTALSGATHPTVRVGFSLETTLPHGQLALREYEPAMRDAVLLSVMSRSAEQLETPNRGAAWEQIRAEVLAKLRSQLPDLGIKQLYFSEITLGK